MHIPLYQRVYEGLRADILAGVYQVGERLPSESTISERFEVSAITTKRALDLLRNDGLIVRRPRLGTFVTSATPTTGPTPAADSTVPLLGLVVTTFDDTFGTRVIEGILDAAGGRANVMLKRTRGDLDLEDAHLRALVASGVDGLLLLPSSSQFIPPAVLELVSRQFPVVILDRIFDAVPVSSVCSDNLGGAKAATEHLFALGHQKVAMVSASSATTCTRSARRSRAAAATSTRTSRPSRSTSPPTRSSRATSWPSTTWPSSCERRATASVSRCRTTSPWSASTTPWPSPTASSSASRMSARTRPLSARAPSSSSSPRSRSRARSSGSSCRPSSSSASPRHRWPPRRRADVRRRRRPPDGTGPTATRGRGRPWLEVVDGGSADEQLATPALVERRHELERHDRAELGREPDGAGGGLSPAVARPQPLAVEARVPEHLGGASDEVREAALGVTAGGH